MINKCKIIMTHTIISYGCILPNMIQHYILHTYLHHSSLLSTYTRITQADVHDGITVQEIICMSAYINTLSSQTFTHLYTIQLITRVDYTHNNTNTTSYYIHIHTLTRHTLTHYYLTGDNGFTFTYPIHITDC